MRIMFITTSNRYVDFVIAVADKMVRVFIFCVRRSPYPQLPLHSVGHCYHPNLEWKERKRKMLTLNETAQRLASYSLPEKLEYCRENVLDALERWKQTSDETAVTIEVILSYLDQDASIPPESLSQWRQAIDTHPDSNHIYQARAQGKRYLAQFSIANTRLKELWNGKGFEDLEPGDTAFPVRALPMIIEMAKMTDFQDVRERLERQKDQRLGAGRSQKTTIQPRDVRAVLQDLRNKDAASANQSVLFNQYTLTSVSAFIQQPPSTEHPTSAHTKTSTVQADLVNQFALDHPTLTEPAAFTKQSSLTDESFGGQFAHNDRDIPTEQPLTNPSTSADQPVTVNASSPSNQAVSTHHTTTNGARPKNPRLHRKRRKALDGTSHCPNKARRKSPERRLSTNSDGSDISSAPSIEKARKDRTSLSKPETMDESNMTDFGYLKDDWSETQEQDAVNTSNTAMEQTDGRGELDRLPAGVPEDGASMLGGMLAGASGFISPSRSPSASPRLSSSPNPGIDAAQHPAMQERELEVLRNAGRLDDALLMTVLHLEVGDDSEPVMLIDTLESKPTAKATPSHQRRSMAKASVMLLLPHHCPESEHWVLYVFFPSIKRLEYYDSLYDVDRCERHLAPVQACLSRLLDEECICRPVTGQCAQQSNAVDCGIYLLEAVNNLVNGRDVSTDLDPIAARLRWAHQLETFNQQRERETRCASRPAATPTPALRNVRPPVVDEFLSSFDETLRTSFANQSSLRQNKYTECERDHRWAAEQKQRCHRALLQSKQRLDMALRRMAYAQKHEQLARDAEPLLESNPPEAMFGGSSVTEFKLALQCFSEAAMADTSRMRNDFSAIEKSWTEALEKVWTAKVAETEAAESLSRWQNYAEEMFNIERESNQFFSL
ncbi:MAG: hypothetical protein Q9210_005943 [Variospora velana]